jgi:uncharacterized coiled-coil DUF342 family protein
MNPLNALRKEEIRDQELRDDEIDNQNRPEARNEIRNDERLTTADIANPPRPNSPATPIRAAADANGGNSRMAAPGQPVQHNPLFPQDELQNFRTRWDQVQTSFVDEPRAAVEQADSLVANVVKRIAEQFATEREQLEKQWDRGENVNTEDLRQALKRYRAFFDRLLTF